jgi:hypothetical protein
MTHRFFLALVVATCGVCTLSFASEATQPEQAVVVHFNYGNKDLSALFALEDRLDAAIKTAHVGEYDGHEIAIDASRGTLYMYGPDADKLFAVAKPILVATRFTSTAKVVLRYGLAGKGAREVVVQLGT